jgi:hypothetical protein
MHSLAGFRDQIAPESKPRRSTRVCWWLMLAIAIPIAILGISMTDARPTQATVFGQAWIDAAHLVCGGIALLVGPFGFHRGILIRAPSCTIVDHPDAACQADAAHAAAAIVAQRTPRQLPRRALPQYPCSHRRPLAFRHPPQPAARSEIACSHQVPAHRGTSPGAFVVAAPTRPAGVALSLRLATARSTPVAR